MSKPARGQASGKAAATAKKTARKTAARAKKPAGKPAATAKKPSRRASSVSALSLGSIRITSPADQSTVQPTFDVLGTVSPTDATVTAKLVDVNNNQFAPNPAQVQASGGTWRLRFFNVPDGNGDLLTASIVDQPDVTDTITINVKALN